MEETVWLSDRITKQVGVVLKEEKERKKKKKESEGQRRPPLQDMALRSEQRFPFSKFDPRIGTKTSRSKPISWIGAGNFLNYSFKDLFFKSAPELAIDL